MTKDHSKQNSLMRSHGRTTAPSRLRGMNLPVIFFLLPGQAATLFAIFMTVQLIFPVFSADSITYAAGSDGPIAVFDFESERGLHKEAADLLAVSIRNEIAKRGKYKIMERSVMNSLLSKHSFVMTNDITIEYAVEAGRALKINTAIIGYVSKKSDTYYLTLSRINVNTGTVDFIVEDKCSGGNEELTRLGKTALGKLLGDVKVVHLRPTIPENKRFTVRALSIFDITAKLEWMRDSNSAAKTMTWGEAVKYVAQLNSQGYAGSSDWRLPQKDELAAIIEYAKNEGVKNNINELYAKIGFKNMKAEYYWSATSTEEIAGLVWVIDLYTGTMSTTSKNGSFYVWPVRGPIDPEAAGSSQ